MTIRIEHIISLNLYYHYYHFDFSGKYLFSHHTNDYVSGSRTYPPGQPHSHYWRMWEREKQMPLRIGSHFSIFRR